MESQTKCGHCYEGDIEMFQGRSRSTGTCRGLDERKLAETINKKRMSAKGERKNKIFTTS